ncbi:MAG: hypothetical protein AAB250_16725 [Bdellovibrionota bacterium]
MFSAFASTARAKNDEFNDFYAYRFADMARRAKTPEDLYKKFPLNEKAREMIKKDVDGKPKAEFDKAPIEMDGSRIVVFKATGRDVRFDFENFDSGVLLVNGKKIEMAAEKTYLNYKNEIAAAIGPQKTSAFSFFIEEAHAQTMSPAEAEAMAAAGRAGVNWLAGRAAAALYATRPEQFTFANMRTSRDSTLADNISRAFEQDLKVYLPTAFNPKTDVIDSEVGGYFPPTFNCTNGHVTQIARALPRSSRDREPVREILAKTATGWVYRATLDAQPITLDNDFKVVTTVAGVADKGQNFLNHVQNPWRYFPRLAERCCAQAGCYKKVSAAAQPNFQQQRAEIQQRENLSRPAPGAAGQ